MSSLRKKAANSGVGLSPFKDEKTPSFSVRRNPPLFYDYSSGVGGNLYTFVKQYHRCSNREAVEIIKRYAGCDDEVLVRREKMAATLVCKKFQKQKSPLKSPSTTTLPDDYMQRYEKRAEKLQVWMQEGISKESLEKFQVFYDAFSDRLVYPIRNADGKIVNVGGRILSPNWKEAGLRKYTYFFGWGGSMNVIYGLFENFEEIKKKREIIIFEGCKSVLLADSFGIHNTGALLTSHVSTNQLKILAGLGFRVVFALDKDVRIRDDHNIKRLKQFVNVSYIYDTGDLLDDKDSPVDKGREVFLKLYEGRFSYR